ncbi:MAG: CvpA family protein [Verrucomicrobia bacterium]|nr:CvpA family protein [Verrucomicrobiota bacterium]
MDKILEEYLKFATQVQLGWFDFVVSGFLVVGVLHGRRKGMTGELFDVFQWLLIVVGGAYAYQPFGAVIREYTQMEPMACSLTAYFVTAFLIKIAITAVKHRIGEQLIKSDVFGRMEFYLGMMGGALRYACMLLMFMAVLNAKYITPAELARVAKMQKDNFGDISFPTLGSVQQDIFKKSLVGQLTKKHLGHQLIIVGDGEPKRENNREGLGQRRTKELEDVIDGGRKN